MDIGGALVAETGIINNTNFTGNIGNDGGAVYLSRDGAMIVNSQFMENIAKNEGGAMFLHGGGTIVNANFTKNNARSGGVIVSGGYLFSKSDVSIKDSIFTDNTANSGVNNVLLKKDASLILDNVTPMELGPTYYVFIKIVGAQMSHMEKLLRFMQLF